MADVLSFELVSPERSLARTTAAAVVIPGVGGEFTAMPNHAPFLSTLRPGFVTVQGGEGAGRYFVTGGFAEVSPEAVSVLAEEAIEADKVSADWLNGKIAQAEAAAAETAASTEASEDRKQIALQRVMDYKAIASQIGA